MPLAFLILAHRNPAQVARLFSALYHREDTFVLHFDSRASAELHTLGAHLDGGYPNVHLLPSRAIIWAGPQMAEVQVEAMQVALEHGTRWTHFLNLTGQDFPLKSRAEMLARLEHGRSYLSWFDPLLLDGPWRAPGERLTRYHLSGPGLQRLLSIPGLGRSVRRVFGWQNQLPWIPGYRRAWPRFFRYYGGANHVALARAAAQHLVEDPTARKIRHWLRHAGHSDEILFQSVLLNSALAPTLVNETWREIDFPAHSPHPRTFTSEDLPRLLRSAALLARKFDAATDPRVLDVLESRLHPALNP